MRTTTNIGQDITVDLFRFFTESKWMKLGQRLCDKVRLDLSKGVLQGVKETDWYRSRQYMKYKKNEMRKQDGKRLKTQSARKIESTETRHVNLTLTGDTKNSLRPRKADKYGVEIGIDPKHAGKILGNRKYGREMIGLNEENRELATKILIDTMIDPGLKEFARGKININIKL